MGGALIPNSCDNIVMHPESQQPEALTCNEPTSHFIGATGGQLSSQGAQGLEDKPANNEETRAHVILSPASICISPKFVLESLIT